MNDPFARLGRAMVRLRWPVLGVWLVALVLVGGLLAPRAASVLKGGGYTDPRSEAGQAARILDREFNASITQSVTVVFRSPSLTVDQPFYRDRVENAAQQLAAVHGVRGVETVYSSGNPLLTSQDQHTTLALVVLEGDEGELQEMVPEIRAALDGIVLEHYVTGFPAVNYDLSLTSEQDLRRAEVFTIPIVVVLLLLVFRTVVAALLPLVVGAGSVVLAMGMLYLIGSRTDASVFALNVASMIGLGLGIDFSLIIVNRFREEIAAGRSREDALAMTIATAGRSITYSGLTVLLSMAVLTALFNLMIVRSISMAVMLVAMTALVAGLTLLPATLAILGHRIEWLRVIPRRRAPASGAEGFWYRLSRRIMRRPWIWLALSLGLLLALAVPAARMRLYGPSPDAIPASKESVQGVQVVREAFGPGRLTPVQIVLQAPEANGAFRPDFLAGLQRLSEAAAADPRNEEVFSLSTLARQAGLPADQFATLTPALVQAAPGGAQFGPRFVNLNGRTDTAVVTIFSKFSQFTPEHEEFVKDLRSTIIPGIPELASFRVLVGGSSADFIDFRDSMYSRFPVLVLGVAAVTFVLLLMFFQSIFLPLKAILMNLASILATYGILVLIFQDGYGESLLGFTSVDAIAVFTPAVLFAILFGLSTDYEVFMLSRVKEYYHATGDNEEAVAAGLEHTAGVITAAGLILVGTFGSFATGRALAIKEIGLGLAIGVLLDSTIVRVIMVPATMRLASRANWWLPAWLKRIVPELKEAPTGAFEPAPAAVASNGMVLETLDGAASSPATLAVPRTRMITDSPPRATIGVLRPVGASIGVERIVLPQFRPLRIGRADDNNLQLFDARVSTHHAQIHNHRGAFFVTDLGSTNGTFINGQRLTQPTVLRHGDQLEFGGLDAVQFFYTREAAPLVGRLVPGV